jgi:hypothetical protein
MTIEQEILLELEQIERELIQIRNILHRPVSALEVWTSWLKGSWTATRKIFGN